MEPHQSPIRILLNENDRLYVYRGKDFIIRDIPTQIPKDTLESWIVNLVSIMYEKGIFGTQFDYLYQFIRFEMP